MSDHISFRRDGAIAIVELNRPEKRNALSEQLLGELTETLNRLDGGTRVVVLRAAPGSKVFSAGHDIDELPLDGSDPLTDSSHFERSLAVLRNFPLPIIAQVSGGVWGGAVEFVLSCDLVLADPTASFAVTPAKLGLPYNTAGIAFFLSRLPAAFVKELFLTAQALDAETALRHGLVSRLLPVSELARETLELAHWMAGLSPRALHLFKRQIAVLSSGTSSGVDPKERETIETLRGEMYAEGGELSQGVAAFRNKRSADFKPIDQADSGSR
ncbi:methylmalonyl-CoA decarboxylase [Psychromicrobium silvestre]|uniref:Methylmalonyl-CoA decarboxylase n=1 Tax=Psychromicrobium silvestre TaxID=1645614 RepID=A0A7Y9S8B4_9MICC|nr:enoyl-CoA hydratase-related protein [Psychromicrobium silvestre]NYE95796.1 methylmalonyl-CoA decarboxylase [Psychromicrobium silvestre]